LEGVAGTTALLVFVVETNAEGELFSSFPPFIFFLGSETETELKRSDVGEENSGDSLDEDDEGVGDNNNDDDDDDDDGAGGENASLSSLLSMSISEGEIGAELNDENSEDDMDDERNDDGDGDNGSGDGDDDDGEDGVVESNDDPILRFNLFKRFLFSASFFSISRNHCGT
jgi:hypothetical protein